MSDDGWLWGDASVAHPDWVGTARMDQRMTGPRLEEIVGLDPDQWHVIGLDIGGGEHAHNLRVVAVHQDLMPPGGDVLRVIAARNDGEIPVTEFLVHDVDPYAVLKAFSHVFEMRLRLARVRDVPMRVMSQSDIPEQFMQED